MLTKREKRFWLTPGKTIPCTFEVVSNAVDIIDRLVKENEELLSEREVNMEMLNRYIDRCKYYEPQLDAIKKAWGATMDKASDDVFDALDNLIGET